MQRHSKKRQAILDCLCSSREHPSAKWIHEQLSREFPDLSLATVYRNLAQLKDAGVIRSMGNVLGQERFDGTVLPHSHAICARCGKIIDISVPSAPPEYIRSVEAETEFKVLSSSLQFSGICKECLGAQSKKNKII